MANRADPRRVRMLSAHFKKATKEPNEYIKFAIDEKDVNVWFVKFYGLDTPYKGGEYIAKFIAPENFPYDPPKFEFLTPNGLYDADGKMRPCVSIGEYHKGDYPSVLGMHEFPMQILGTLISWDTLGHGISVVNTTEDEKQKLADQSAEFNRTRFTEINDMIEAQYAKYSEGFPKKEGAGASAEAESKTE